MTAPIIDNFDPSIGVEIEFNDPVKFDVTDPSTSGAFDIIAVGVSFNSGKTFDLVHDGDNFRGAYTGSQRSAIADGFAYTANRTGGWPSTPTFEWFVVNNLGEEAVIVP